MFRIIDPITDIRWEQFVTTHRESSIFHHKGWLKALKMTYGYRPLVVTSTPDGEPLSDGVVFAEVMSWITGARLVSLPFADHCEPLVRETDTLSELCRWLSTESRAAKWRYIELRPLSRDAEVSSHLEVSNSFWHHSLDLTAPLGQIFTRFHKSCTQRRIRHADHAGLTYEKGNSSRILADFYRLLTITRRRQQLLPQPLAWFGNLVTCLGNNLDIRVAHKDSKPLAAILTLRHGHNVVYKYGCSDESANKLAPMPFLFWRMIEESKGENAQQIDFGRTDLENRGLTAFKDHFGTTRRPLTYVRYPMSESQRTSVAAYLPGARRLFSVLPDVVSSRLGGLLYPHIG